MSRKKLILILIGGIIIALFIFGRMFSSITGKYKLPETDKIAVINIESVITGGRGQDGLMGEGKGTDYIIKRLEKAKDDPVVKAVIIRINSPGGSAAASQEVGVEIKRLRATGKLVVTSMGDTAASGGYWIAANTDKIYADPATITGSIGVYIPYTNYAELMKKIGVSQEKIKSGPHKDILSPERPMTPEERAIIQGMVDDIYNQFIEVVAEGRKMDQAKVRSLADGRVYTGRQAKELGLVDELGSLNDAIEAVANMVGITGKPEVKEYQDESIWDMVFGTNTRVSFSNLLLKRAFLGEYPGNPEFPIPISMPLQRLE